MSEESTTTGTSWLPFAWTFLGASLLYVATNSPSALYPVYERIYGITPLTVTTIYGVYAGSLIPTLIITGSLGHVIGFRRLLAIAWLLAALGVGVFAAAQAPWMLYAARLLQGVAVGLATGALAAALVALDRDRDDRRASVALTVAISIGGGLGPIIAGVLVTYLPWPNRLTFVVLAVLLTIPAVGFLFLPKDLGVTGVTWQPRLPAVPDGDRRPFLLACAGSFIVWAVAALFLALVPSYFHEATHSTSSLLAAAAAGLTLTTAGIAQLATGKQDPWRAQRAGVVIVCLGLLALVIAGELKAGWLILASAVLAGGGMGMAFLGATNAVNRLSSHRPDHAGVFATYFLISYCGSGIPIMGVGLLGNLIGTESAVLVFACIAGILSLIWLLLMRGDPARPAHQEGLAVTSGE